MARILSFRAGFLALLPARQKRGGSAHRILSSAKRDRSNFWAIAAWIRFSNPCHDGQPQVYQCVVRDRAWYKIRTARRTSPSKLLILRFLAPQELVLANYSLKVS